MFAFVVPDSYPFHPPRVQCLTKVLHPNIDWRQGTVALRMLTQDWKPIINMNTVIFGLQLLFLEYDPTYVINPNLVGCTPNFLFAAVRHTFQGGVFLGVTWPSMRITNQKNSKKRPRQVDNEQVIHHHAKRMRTGKTQTCLKKRNRRGQYLYQQEEQQPYTTHKFFLQPDKTSLQMQVLRNMMPDCDYLDQPHHHHYHHRLVMNNNNNETCQLESLDQCSPSKRIKLIVQ